MSISGIGGSNLFFHEESVYGAVPTIIDANIINMATRPGAIPSETFSRVSARVVGSYTDRSLTLPVRSTVAGTFSFNIDSNNTNSNSIHQMAGVSTTNLTEDIYSSLKSFSVYLPLTEKDRETGEEHTSGIPISGLVFNGMMVNQYSISLPSDNSLLECSLGFIGRNITDSNQSGSLGNWGNIISDDSSRNAIQKLGSPFETWTAAISLGGSGAVATTDYMSVSSLSINIANTLTPGNFATSGSYISRPTPSDRSVTGSFTVPYSSDGNNTHDDLIALVKSNGSVKKQFKIVLNSSRAASSKTLTILMPTAVIMQGQSLNSLSPGYAPMSFSFKAFGLAGSADEEIQIQNAG